MSAPPMMEPARPEMRAEDCHGAPSERFGAYGGSPCGRKVEWVCRKCGVHRCARCALANPNGQLHAPFCPTCAAANCDAPEVLA